MTSIQLTNPRQALFFFLSSKVRGGANPQKTAKNDLEKGLIAGEKGLITGEKGLITGLKGTGKPARSLIVKKCRVTRLKELDRGPGS